MIRIALLPGDGVGPEVLPFARRALEIAGAAHGAEYAFEDLPWGADRYLDTGETLPEGELRRLRAEADAVLAAIRDSMDENSGGEEDDG